MGRNKAQLRLGARTLLSWARAGARAAGLQVRVIRRDLWPRCGPLGGIYTGLRQTRSDAVLFLSCDMPFVTADLIELVLSQLKSDRLAVFVRRDGRFGFPCLIRTTALPIVEGLLANQQFSIQALALALKAWPCKVPAAMATALFNVNTPEDYRQASLLLNNQRDARFRG
jgi:molybdenum cofactor guanylyltransferase